MTAAATRAAPGAMTLVAQISDLHVGAAGALAYGRVDCAAMLANAVQSLLQLPQRPQAVVASGDLTDLAGKEDYAHLRQLLAPLDMPVFLMPGNHDDREALRAVFPEHAYLRQTGRFIQYAVDVGELRLIALDSVIEREAGGRLCEESLDWLERTLGAAPQRPALVFVHHPPFRSFIGHMDRIALENPGQLESVIARHSQVERVLCGHLHRPVQVRFAGTLALSCASVAHQVELDLAEDRPGRFVFEPPAYLLHAWRADTGVVTHTVYVGEHRGPFPFY